MRKAASVLLAIVFVFTTACGDDGGTGPAGSGATSSLEVNLSNGVSESFTDEEAIFVTPLDSLFSVFNVSDTTTRLHLVELVSPGPRPSPGTYSMFNGSGEMPDSMFALLIDYDNAADEDITLGNTTGTVTIDESTSDHVKGTFDVQVVGGNLTTGDSINARATGSFTAIKQSLFNSIRR